MRLSCVLGALLLSLLVACTPTSPPLSDSQHLEQVETWFTDRITRLEAEHGWLSLVGLLPLPEGESSFGTDEGSDILFPGPSPDLRLGTFIRQARSIEVRSAGDDTLLHEGETVASMPLQTDRPGPATVLTAGSLRFFLIERGDRVLIRIVDPESITRAEFSGIERWPVGPEWRLTAQFEPHPVGATLAVPNILGDVIDEASPGKVRFAIDGQRYSIDALEGGANGNLFLVFGDLTNGKRTYGGGRFLSSEAPGADGTVVIDFNRAYNPPCVFTPFATCPLPPRQNRLALEITAGERGYALH